MLKQYFTRGGIEGIYAPRVFIPSATLYDWKTLTDFMRFTTLWQDRSLTKQEITWKGYEVPKEVYPHLIAILKLKGFEEIAEPESFL